jgi:hypothetical protein
VSPVFGGLTRSCHRVSWRVTDCPEYAVKCRSAARLGDAERASTSAWQLVFHLVGRIDAGSDVKALGNTAATAWFGLSALPHRGDFAHDGWAIHVLEPLARPREEAIRVRSVVE